MHGPDRAVVGRERSGPAEAGRSATDRHTDAVWSVAFRSDGRVLASASADRTTRLWDVSAPATPTGIGRPLTGQTGAVFAVALAPAADVRDLGAVLYTLLTSRWPLSVARRFSSDHRVWLWHPAQSFSSSSPTPRTRGSSDRR